MTIKRLLTLSFFVLVLFVPFLATAAIVKGPCRWIVSGAGTAAVNGTYTLYTDDANQISGPTIGKKGTLAYVKDGVTASSPILVVTSGSGTDYNATEIRGTDASGLLAGTPGYYYTVGSPTYPENYSFYTNVNAQGTGPIPTAKHLGCHNFWSFFPF